MKLFKVVPCQGQLLAKKDKGVADIFEDIGHIISAESLGGWELLTCIPVNVLGDKKGKVNVPYNALVFCKESDGQENEKPKKEKKSK